MQVRATDPDVDRNSQIRYSLMGQFADDGSFVINEHTGEVFATRALDRDPRVRNFTHFTTATDRDPPGGRAVWNFNVLAHDEINGYRSSLTGYAEVRVIPRDVNDNAPVFDQNRLVGRVPEHSLLFNALTLLVGLCSL